MLLFPMAKSCWRRAASRRLQDVKLPARVHRVGETQMAAGIKLICRHRRPAAQRQRQIGGNEHQTRRVHPAACGVESQAAARNTDIANGRHGLKREVRRIRQS